MCQEPDGRIHPSDNVKVAQWGDMVSTYSEKTGRLYVHGTSFPRKHTPQQYYFHSVQSIAGTLTRAHKVRLWDLRRNLSPRETARLFGFPETFRLPRSQYNSLFGNSVAVPCVKFACSKVLDGTERTHIDLCSGIGGFSIGVRSFAPQIKCIGFSEIFKPAIDCYLDNFPCTPSLGDLQQIDSFPKCDLLTAGFPCQPFSTANSLLPNNLHKSADFFHTVLLAIRKTECTRIILENVATFLTVGKDKWSVMKSVLVDELGFKLEWGVLDACDFGVPQKRKRLFIVGKRNGSALLPLAYEPSLPRPTIKDILDKEVPNKSIA